MLTLAAAYLRNPNACMTANGMRSCGWLMLKFPKDLCVCAPHNLFAGTSIGPKASVSVLVEGPAISAEVLKVLELEKVRDVCFE